MTTHVSVDVGYGYVKAISSTGNRVIFPSLVGQGSDNAITKVFGSANDLSNMQITYNGINYLVGEAAIDSPTVSRVFESNRWKHVYYQILLNTAIQLVTEGTSETVNVSVGLPLDFYGEEAKEFRKHITVDQPSIDWKTGKFKGMTKQTMIGNAVVFPQGASAIFSALMNHDGNYSYPQFMKPGSLIGLIDIGFRTTDYIVIEIKSDGSFSPKTHLSGTIEAGVVNLHREITNLYKRNFGGTDLKEGTIQRFLMRKELVNQGKIIPISNEISTIKKQITDNIAESLNIKWADESAYLDGIFMAGGGSELFGEFMQDSYKNRLIKLKESQFANAIGYLRLGNRVFQK